MGAYNYKYVRDQLPPYLTDEVDGYEGNCDYDGDMWCAASDYISQLEAELVKQYSNTNVFHDKKLLNWLQTRQRTNYVDGPVIVSKL